ncbi:MAG: PAS domain-containing protein [Alphaproteobacteria bacterium]|nr:PAS domain-containing protein [Alphaproteobacteria bacterium]
MTIAFHLPEDCDHRVRAIYDYWCAIRPGARLPTRADMDPVDIPALLPHVWMADVEHSPFRFRFRLVGSAIVRGLGRDVTGRYFEDCFDDFEGSGPYNTLAEVCSTGAPTWRRGPALLTREGYNVKQIERVFLPFAADGESVDLLLALSVYVLED